MFTLANNNVLGARAVVARTRGGGATVLSAIWWRDVCGVRGGGRGEGQGVKQAFFFSFALRANRKRESE